MYILIVLCTCTYILIVLCTCTYMYSIVRLYLQCVEKCKPSGAQAYLLEEGLLISWILLSRADSSPDSGMSERYEKERY